MKRFQLRTLTCVLASAALFAVACEEESTTGGDVGTDATSTSDMTTGTTSSTSTTSTSTGTDMGMTTGTDTSTSLTDTSTTGADTSTTAADTSTTAADTSTTGTDTSTTTSMDTTMNMDMGMTGMATCGEINGCLGNCGQMDTACQNACIASGSPAAQMEFNNLAMCLQTNCAMAMDLQACADMNCPTELEACFGPVMTGDLTCDEVFTCFDTCPVDGMGNPDQMCLQDCFNSGSAAAQQQYNDIVACNTTNMCMGDGTCLQTNCPTELDACFGAVGTAFCLDDCTQTQMCADAMTFCFDLDATSSVCAAGDANAPAIPANATECDAQGMCPNGQVCVQTQ